MSSFLGVDPTVVDTTQKWTLGQRWTDELTGKTYMYVKAGGAIVPANNCKLTVGFVATALAGVGNIFGISGVTAAVNNFFWLQIGGEFANANLATGVLAADLIAWLADANGDFIKVAAAAADGPRGQALENEAAGVGDVILFLV